MMSNNEQKVELEDTWISKSVRCTDVQILPVFYITSSPPGPLPKKGVSICRSIPQLVEWLWNQHAEHWAIRSSVRSLDCTANSFACSALLASLARSAALIHALVRSLTHLLSSSWESDLCLCIERVDLCWWIEWVVFIKFHPTVRPSVGPCGTPSPKRVRACARRIFCHVTGLVFDPIDLLLLGLSIDVLGVYRRVCLFVRWSIHR